jgi:hypothetical protein
MVFSLTILVDFKIAFVCFNYNVSSWGGPNWKMDGLIIIFMPMKSDDRSWKSDTKLKWWVYLGMDYVMQVIYVVTTTNEIPIIIQT